MRGYGETRGERVAEEDRGSESESESESDNENDDETTLFFDLLLLGETGACNIVGIERGTSRE